MRTISKSISVVLTLVLLAGTSCMAQSASPGTLNPGDKAPNFTLQASDGKTYQLAQYAGKKFVAICWFPRAGSQGAKLQCASLQAAMAKVPADKVQVFGCSTAALDVTTAFGQDGKYSFPVLADASHAVAKAYGCLRSDGLGERWTFLIDDKGVVLAVNKNISAETQGAELLQMLVDKGLLPKTAGVTALAPVPQLVPGAKFTVKFPEMPPTLYDLWNKQSIAPAMTVFLPRNYDPQRKHPLLLFLNGWDGGDAANPGVARALSEEQDFICVILPLFKESIDPNAPANTPPLIIIRDADGKYAWPLYRTMLTKLDEMVPNIDPAHRILGGFSNGAHMTGELIDQSAGEAARMFSAFFMVEGGGRTQRYDLIKGKPLMLLIGRSLDLPRFQEIGNAAKTAGVKLTVHEMPGVGHAFPASEYPAVREWLHGPAME